MDPNGLNNNRWWGLTMPTTRLLSMSANIWWHALCVGVGRMANEMSFYSTDKNMSICIWMNAWYMESGRSIHPSKRPPLKIDVLPTYLQRCKINLLGLAHAQACCLPQQSPSNSKEILLSQIRMYNAGIRARPWEYICPSADVAAAVAAVVVAVCCTHSKER